MGPMGSELHEGTTAMTSSLDVAYITYSLVPRHRQAGRQHWRAKSNNLKVRPNTLTISPQNSEHTECAKHLPLFTHSLSAWSCACAPSRASPAQQTQALGQAGAGRPPYQFLYMAYSRSALYGVHTILDGSTCGALAAGCCRAHGRRRGRACSMHARPGPELASAQGGSAPSALRRALRSLSSAACVLASRQGAVRSWQAHESRAHPEKTTRGAAPPRTSRPGEPAERRWRSSTSGAAHRTALAVAAPANTT